MSYKNYLFLLFLFLVFECFSQKHVNIIVEEESYTLTKTYVFSEETPKYGINFIIKNDTILEKVDSQIINRGVFKKNHWVKIELLNTSETINFNYEFINNYVDSVKVYLVKNNIIEKKFKTKGLLLDNEREYLTNKYSHIYPFQIKKGETKSIYINAFIDDGPFLLENKLLTQQGLVTRNKEIRFKTNYLVLFLGFVSLVMILSLGMFIFSKRVVYLYYLGFIFAVSINIVCVHSFISQKVIEDYLLFGNNYTEMFSYLQVIFILLYTDSFLKVNKDYPKISKLIKFLAVLNIVFFLLGMYLREFDLYYSFSFFFSKIMLLLSIFLLYIFPFYMMIKGNFMARFFVVAYTPLTLFVVYILLRALGLVDFTRPNWVLITFFEILVLTLAMVYQYFLILKQNSKYQQQIITQKENQIIEIFNVQNSERKRISQDIHDGILQKIGLLNIKAKEIFSSKFKNSNKQKEEKFINDLTDSINELRNISHQIMPSDLEENISLEDSIKNLLLDSLSVVNITYNFEYFNLKGQYSINIKYIFYRVSQELINNVIKHSKAKNITVQLFENKGFLNLLFEDDGIGFNLEKTNNGIGLSNIRSRINAINGSVEIESKEGLGTYITVKIQLNND